MSDVGNGAGGWRIKIAHRTGFHYDATVVASFNEARMTPLTTPAQTTLESRITVTPQAATHRYWDYWGTYVTAFDVQVPHDQLTVSASSVVETLAVTDPADEATWEYLRSEECQDRFTEFLVPTEQTEPGSELVEMARSRVGALAPQAASRAVAEWISDEVEYVPGSTGVHTSAEESWAERKGVCQDFAHILVSALRHFGVPARYVSGYLHPRPDAELFEVVSGQSHAWVEWWTGDWHAFDPTNGRPAGADHVFVARGRDYSDVPPLKGVYSGAAASELFVAVDVTRLA